MDDNTELLIEQRLSVFSDEPDLNDWFEVMCGAAMAVLGLFHLVEPGELVDPDLMRWFAASVIAAGAVWAGHGLKDMAVKEMRRSTAMMELTSDAPTNTVDHGLIRDVLLNPDAYKDFLTKAYEEAWSDGIITEEELKDLKKFQTALGISDEDAEKLSARARKSNSEE
ncbi:MAG: hypothetical protein ACPHUK_01870 [Candidatus Poseidoniaceae archaeon]